MYRYLLFTYSENYPAGGMDDCVLKTNDLEELAKHIAKDNSQYMDIYDCHTGETHHHLDKLKESLVSEK